MSEFHFYQLISFPVVFFKHHFRLEITSVVVNECILATLFTNYFSIVLYIFNVGGNTFPRLYPAQQSFPHRSVWRLLLCSIKKKKTVVDYRMPHPTTSNPPGPKEWPACYMSVLKKTLGPATRCDAANPRRDVLEPQQCIKIACDALQITFQQVGNLEFRNISVMYCLIFKRFSAK